MNRLLDAILCSRYSNLYRYRDNKTICKWWSYCGDGAFSLLDVMSNLIVKHNPDTFATKVIRRHGGIIFECSNQDEYMNGVSIAGETLSNYICNICGAPGTEDQKFQSGIDVIRCNDHISNQCEFIDYDFISLDCLKDKPAWSRNISILSTLINCEVNNKKSRKFRVIIDENNQMTIKFSSKSDFIRGIADVFACYCNRIDERTGKVLCNQQPLSNLEII
jgi:hypothetical protein